MGITASRRAWTWRNASRLLAGELAGQRAAAAAGAARGAAQPDSLDPACSTSARAMLDLAHPTTLIMLKRRPPAEDTGALPKR